MRDLYILLVYCSFFVFGAMAPFIFTIGYMWVDVFYPQFMTHYLTTVPVSMIMAVAAIGGYLMLDRKAPPRVSAFTLLSVIFALWCTLSLSWAEVPTAAWAKWDWAFKSVMFAAFLPYLIRSRVQIETFLQVFLFAMTLHMLPLGVKNLLSGSSYGRSLGIINENILLLESSTLAAASVAMIPIALYLRKHNTLLPKSKFTDAMYVALVGVAILCAIGTFARTAVIGFIVVGLFMWVQSRRKILFTVCALAMVVGFGYTVSKSWTERIDTTTHYNQDDSALGRILVWKWTLGYAMHNPFGGAFNSFYIDVIEFPAEGGEPPVIIHGKAFHNIYMEVLGEQGFPGLAMYIAIQAIVLGYLRRIRRRTRDKPYMLWCHDLAGTLMVSLVTLLACGNFVGIGYQSTIWYALSLPACLLGYVTQVERLEARTAADPRMAPARRQAGLPIARPAR
jgi:putative inorganic carbon (HCO3(-)) transporter